MKHKILNTSVIVLSVMIFAFGGIGSNYAEAASTPAKTSVQTVVSVSPVEVVNCPSKYLNKTITFNAEFVSYSALGLDYKPALREASKYISVLIRRSDVNDHVIPLSEMKLFLKRETAEKNAELEAGDKIKITGKVFSTALGDPWVDITSFTVLEQKSKKK